MDSIDRLLANLTPDKLPQDGPQDGPQKVQQSAVNSPVDGSIDQLLERLGEPQKQQVRDSLLAPEVEVYGKQQAAIAQATQQAAIAQAQQQAQQQAQLKHQRQEALRLQRQQELRSQAQDWLDDLDLKSTEGRWFEEFACHYDSQLDAAIAYLAALQEVDHFLG
jgi:hypothetical protein